MFALKGNVRRNILGFSAYDNAVLRYTAVTRCMPSLPQERNFAVNKKKDPKKDNKKTSKKAAAKSSKRVLPGFDKKDDKALTVCI